MSDLGIICALFGYLLRLSDDADIMLGYNIICASLEGFHPVAAPLYSYVDIDFVEFNNTSCFGTF